MTKFSQSREIPFCADKYSINQKPLMIRLIEQIHMTSNLQRWQLNLRKTDVSVLTERTSRLIFEKRKYENISYKKKKKTCSFLHLICQGNRLLFEKKKKSERQGACSPCFR